MRQMHSASRQLLRSGAVRLEARAISFVHTRLRPGLLHISATGCDGGELEQLPVRELSRELERFPLATDVFLDASAVRGVSVSAREHWERWLAKRDPRLCSLHLLVNNRSVKWTAEVAAYRARSRVLVVHDRESSFAAALQRLAPAAALPRLLEDCPLHVERLQTPTTLRLSDGRCQILGDVLNEQTRIVRIIGSDCGLLMSEVLDWFATPPNPRAGSRLFFDLTHAALPRQEVAEVWTQWLAANRHRLESVVLFSQLQSMRIVLNIARHLSYAPRLISVVGEYDSFHRAMAA